jgi:hypothetical protein
VRSIDFKVGYLLLCILALNFITNTTIFPLIFIATCCFVIYQNWQHVNIAGLVIIILVMKVVEMPLWHFVDKSNNYIVFASYFLIDLPVILLVTFRVQLSRFTEFRRFGHFDKTRYTITNADLIVGKIYILYCLINVLALVENGLRHLDDFGLDSQSSNAVWLYKNARVIWNNYEYIKHGINMIELIAILTTASNYMRSARILKG